MGWDTLLQFLAATFVFTVMPGPAAIYAAAQTMAHGRRGGLMAALGLHTGGYVHVLGAAFGLSALFAVVPTAYMVLKFAGAAYLVFLGIQILRTRFDPNAEMPTIKARSGNRAFFQSATVEILNPKTAIFFIAFLPQFADPSASLPIWAQLLLLGTFVNISFSVMDICTVYMTDAVVGTMRKSARFVKGVRWAGGSLLIGLGAHLALQQR